MFIRILYPPREKGVTFLKIEQELWQYIPKIEKILKIPPSLMLQSWMGSDFTNDDMVKESSLFNDYKRELIREDETFWELKLSAKQDAAVVWDKLRVKVHKIYELPVRIQYFDQRGVQVRELLYQDFKKLPDRYFPMDWEMKSTGTHNRDRVTRIRVLEIVFDKKLEDQKIFSKRALKWMSP